MEPRSTVKAHPPASATGRERTLWRLIAAYVAALYAAGYFLQFALQALMSRGLLRPTIAALFAAAGITLCLVLLRDRPGPAEWALVAGAAVVLAVAAARLEIIQERLHLLEYGALGGALVVALHLRRVRLAEQPRRSDLGARYPTVTAILLTALAGLGDELWQGLLPNRFYDLRDVLLNAGSGALGAAFVAARRTVRRRRPGGSTRVSDPSPRSPDLGVQ